jgi:uncharacterized protein YjbI with pentapeptide repeats
MSQDDPQEKGTVEERGVHGLDSGANSSNQRPPSGWGPALWIASGMYIAADLRNHEPLRTMITSDAVKTIAVSLAVAGVFVVYLALRASEFRTWRRSRPPRTVESALNVALASDSYEKNLCEAKLFGQDLRSINLDGARCIRIGLEGANMAGSRLAGCDLRGGCLRNVNFSGCDLSNSDLRGADIRGADFTGANLQSANLHEARVGDANFANATFGATILTKIDLSHAKSLDTIHHLSPSTLGVDTLHESRSGLSDVFLRGAGVPEPLWQRLHSSSGSPEPQALCLISYSSADQRFAERLHEDLRSRGIRCWFAPKDMPVGDRIRARLEKSLRECDKVVLVLSRHSLASDWVQKEVDAVLQRERAEGSRSLLLPVVLDDGFAKAEGQWAAEMRRSRPIADFSNWNQQDAYQAALGKVLREMTQEAAATAEAS